MAKQPLKCFNCATCESNIKNVTPSNEYLAWNKYPPGDRIYRMGQGFSHMLQMMTNEFVKNVERNSSESMNYNEQSHKSININDNGRINTNINANSEKSLPGLSVNNKQQFFDDSNTLQRKSGRIKLPIMPRFIKQKKIKNMSEAPVSDDERENNEMLDKMKIMGSPKIVKILKKKKEEINIFSPTEAYDHTINTESNVNSNFVDKNLAKSHNF